MKTIRVAAAVIRDGGMIFATARGYGEYKGWWEFPGGKIENGETPRQALIREIREELTVEIEVGDLIDTIEYDYPDFHLSMDCFWAKITAGLLRPLEAEAVRWLGADELDDVKWLPADKILIDAIRQGLMENKTLAYYEENAESFVTGTVNVDFSDIQDRFLSLLPVGGYILDLGCGSGRDSKYFLEKGYRVDAADGSGKLCEAASAFTGLPVRRMRFAELDEHEKYDGIWACASILHLPKRELRSVMERMIRALRRDGYIYTSFKYGSFEGYRNGRYFTDFTESTFRDFLSGMTRLRIIREWVSSDVRSGRSDERWLNVILMRTGLENKS